MNRILIIDDNPAIHEDFKKILAPRADAGSSALADAKAALFGLPLPKRQRECFEVESALQGEEGWRRVQESVANRRPFAVAFVDMRMPPGWDGLQTIQRLWEVDANLQVVICTAYSDQSWEEITQTLGLTDRLLILKKPFDAVEVSQLATALSEKWMLKKQASLKMGELEDLVKQRTRELSHEAMHDRLTGLPNRLLLGQELQGVIEKRKKDASWRYAVYFLDFDRFKVVNDSMGHRAGDELLTQAATRLTACLKSERARALCANALAARLGGDEFIVVAEGLKHPEDAMEVAAELMRTLSAPYMVCGSEICATASIGLTVDDAGYVDADDAIRDADTAMYHAKAAGKARFVVFDKVMHEKVKARLTLETDLRGAVERNELALWYQPVMCLSTGRLKGFEALIRWNHPSRGLVGPVDFITCAEETGQIVPIGLWVAREACRQLGEWHRKYPMHADLRMSVNVSARQLVSRRIVEQIEEAFTSNRIAPGTLALEITETALITDPEISTSLLEQLKRLGIRLYLDDFGTGYSSLSYLHQLPLDSLKMDKSFMQSVSERRDYAAVVFAIVTLARNLGITVIAEGVETAQQVALLQSMECDFGQGYLFGKPMEAANAEAMISAAPMSLAA